MDPDGLQCEAAEIRFMNGNAFDSIGHVADCGRDGSKMGWAPLSDDGKPGDGISDDAIRRAPLAKSDVSSGVLKVSRHERYVDDLTGQLLSPELCRKARATELDYFCDKEV